MDTLSDTLRAVRLTAAVFVNARLTAPWAIASPPPEPLERVLGLRADGMALIHVVAEGACWLARDDHPPVRVHGPSVIVFTHGGAHTLASRAGLPPVGADLLLRRLTSDEVPRIGYGGGGEPCRLLCGYVHCDHRFNPLIGALPPLIIAPASSGQVIEGSGPLRPPEGAASYAATSVDRLETLVGYALEEADGKEARNAVVLSRLIELIYVEIIRRYAEQLSSGDGGWIGAIQHRSVGRALRLLHEDPARQWTLTQLSRAVGLSRSSFAQHFQELTGTSPARYLACWRIQLAQRLLASHTLSIAQVAARVGYGSSEAFHRAFRRHTGQSPAAWQRERSGAME